MTPLLEQAVAEAAKLSPSHQDDFAHWMLAELANMQQWNKTAAQTADAMEWFVEDTLDEK